MKCLTPYFTLFTALAAASPVVLTSRATPAITPTTDGRLEKSDIVHASADVCNPRCQAPYTCVCYSASSCVCVDWP